MYAPERDRYSPMRLALVGELRHAIETNELLLFYQPKADVGSGDASVIGRSTSRIASRKCFTSNPMNVAGTFVNFGG